MSYERSNYRDEERAERYEKIRMDLRLCPCGSHAQRHHYKCIEISYWCEATKRKCPECKAPYGVECFDFKKRAKQPIARVHGVSWWTRLRAWLRMRF